MKLVEFVSNQLEVHYPCVFQDLRKILQIEGFTNSETCFRKTSFTTFAITRDYNYRPHLDQDDYDLEFILWLKEGMVFHLF